MNDLNELTKQKQFLQNLLTKSSQLVKMSNNLPQQEELIFYSKVPQIKEKQKQINQKVQQIFSSIKNLVVQPEQSNNSHNNLQITNNINRFSNIVEINDVLLLDNVNSAIDKLKKKQQQSENPLQIEQQQLQNQMVQKDDIQKPQHIFFKDQINNSRFPFVPKLKIKHNALVPLDEIIKTAQEQGEFKFFQDVSDLQYFNFNHPYQFELENIHYTKEQLQITIEVQNSAKLEKENLKYVDNSEEFDKMLDYLKEQTLIAIDLEHHHIRSFQGITCLIQISSRTQDFIIDPFPIWHQISRLNEVFSNGNIVKVMHGANKDVEWLQRDFGIYVINLFDTGQAAKQLQLPNLSLQYLLNTYCQVHSDKRFQLADWRLRPLTSEMIKYARSDTHYLLQIFDLLRKELVQKSFQSGNDSVQQIISVLNKSRDICLIKYQKTELQNKEYFDILNKQKGLKAENKIAVLTALLEWRDQVAREEDESLRYVLENDVMFNIVERLPYHINQILNIYNISYILRRRVNDVIVLVKSALDKYHNEQQQQQQMQQQLQQQKSDQQKQEPAQKDNQMQEETSSNIVSGSLNLHNQNRFFQIFTPKNISNTSFQVDSDDCSTLNNQMNSLIIKTVEIKMKKFKSNKTIFSQTSKQNIQLQKIKNSFVYGQQMDLFNDIYPEIKQAQQEIDEKMLNCINNNDETVTNQQIKPEDQENNKQKEIERIDFIELPELKHPAQQNLKQNTQLRLPTIKDFEQQENLKSLSEQQQINLKRKRNKSNQNQSHPINKVQVLKSQFEELQEKEESEENEFEQELQIQNQQNKMNIIAENIKSQIDNRKTRFIQLNDPILSMYGNKNQFNHKKKGKFQNKKFNNNNNKNDKL